MQAGLSAGAPRAAKAALFFLCLAVAPVLTGCSEKPVAVVNGKGLSEKQFSELCATYVPNPNQQQRASVGQMVLASYISRSLLEEEARRTNNYPSEKELGDRLDGMRRQAAYLGSDFDGQLKAEGRTVEHFKRELLDQMIRERLMFGEAQVSDGELKSFWEQQKKNLIQPEQVKISMITVDNQKDLEATRNDLNSPAAQFSLVAQSRSKDPFAQAGGMVNGFIPRQLPPGTPFDQKVIDKAFTMQPGEVSDPIKVGATWVFVKLEEKREKKEPKFEDFREDLMWQMKAQRAQETGKASNFQKRMMEIARTAKIEINRPEYAEMARQIQQGAAAVSGPVPPGAGDGSGPPPPPTP